MSYAFMALRALSTVIFVAAGAKLIGVRLMVGTFSAIG